MTTSVEHIQIQAVLSAAQQRLGGRDLLANCLSASDSITDWSVVEMSTLRVGQQFDV